MRNIIYILFLALMVLLTSCSQQPAEIHYGSDECAHCKMMITDDRFAAQLVTETGKAYKFDAIECLAQYTSANKSELESAKLWVSNFQYPGTWVEAGKAFIVKSKVINSPMGESLLAFETEQQMQDHLAEYPGKQITWQRLTR